MEIKINSIIQRNAVLLALLLHLLLFSGISYTGFFHPAPPQEMPALDIPAYLAEPEAKSPSLVQPSIVKEKEEVKPTSEYGIEKPAPIKKVLPKPDQFQAVKTEPNNEDPVHLIGDKKISKSLIVLLGKAITKHLVYPKSAMDLNVRGTAYYGFMLYPDGRVSEIKLLKTSTANVLDQAAFDAINAISPVKNVNEYIQKPEFIVFGIIFG